MTMVWWYVSLYIYLTRKSLMRRGHMKDQSQCKFTLWEESIYLWSVWATGKVWVEMRQKKEHWRNFGPGAVRAKVPGLGSRECALSHGLDLETTSTTVSSCNAASHYITSKQPTGTNRSLHMGSPRPWDVIGQPPWIWYCDLIGRLTSLGVFLS